MVLRPSTFDLFLVSVLVVSILFSLSATIVDTSNFRSGTYSALSGSGYHAAASVCDLLQGYDGSVHESRHIDMPGFNTVPRPMGRLVRDNHILYPEDAFSYIMPDNEVVR